MLLNTEMSSLNYTEKLCYAFEFYSTDAKKKIKCNYKHAYVTRLLEIN